MRNSALEQNEHLNLGQVLTTLRALEYPSENVVSTVDIEVLLELKFSPSGAKSSYPECFRQRRR